MKVSKDQYGDHFTLWDPLLQKYCDLSQVPFVWLKTIMMIESSLGLNPRVQRGLSCPEDIEGSQSEDGKSWGLLQLEPRTARDFDLIVTPQKLNDPAYSVRIGSLLLRRLFRAFSGEEEWAVKGWNQGQGASVLERAGKIEGNASKYWDKYLIHKEVLNDATT